MQTKVQRPVAQIGPNTVTYKETDRGFEKDEFLVKPLGYNDACKGYHFLAKNPHGKGGTRTVCYTHSAREWVDQ
jgi:hypothetical protein